MVQSSMLAMVVTRRRGLGRKDGGVAFIIIQSGLCIFEIPFWDPRVFFGQVSFPLDQEELLEWGASVV